MKQTLSGNIIDIHARRIYGGTVTIDDGRIVAVEEDGHTITLWCSWWREL